VSSNYFSYFFLPCVPLLTSSLYPSATTSSAATNYFFTKSKRYRGIYSNFSVL
jgi:hypothetical protein